MMRHDVNKAMHNISLMHSVFLHHCSENDAWTQVHQDKKPALYVSYDVL